MIVMVRMLVMVRVGLPAMAMAAISAALGLERSIAFGEFSAEPHQHGFDHMVWPNDEGIGLDFRWQMPVTQVPSQPGELMGIAMPHLHHGLKRGANPQPSAIVEPQPVAIRHGDRLWEIEQHVVARIGNKLHSAAVPRIEVERYGALRLCLEPVPLSMMMNGPKHLASPER